MRKKKQVKNPQLYLGTENINLEGIDLQKIVELSSQ